MRLWLVLIGLCFLGGLTLPAGHAQTTGRAPLAQTLRGADFARGDSHGVSAGPDGLQPSAGGGTVTSLPQATAAPFNYLLAQWEASVPVSATLALELRVSADGTNWSKWGALEINDDLLDQRDGPDTYWGPVLYAGTAQHWQLRASLAAAPDGQAPTLVSVTISTVDSRDASQRPLQPEPQHRAPNSLARPGFVSRWGWGGPEVADNSVPADYYRADHLVVHHTADLNTLVGNETSWADRVLAEWRFHTYPSGRGWGDVGYNWLIDPNGTIYEGRRGSSDLSQDAVGFHDTANYGSMGVVLLGTFDSAAPTAAAQTSLVNLLAWKSEQRQIDPYGSSYYYGCARSGFCYPYHSGAVVANLAGHREVLPGHTSCPGDQAINVLPSVRQRVAGLLQPPTPDNGDTTVDDQETSFWRSAATWYETGGFNSHSWYTYATDTASQSSNQGRWTPNLPVSGEYKVEAYIPQNTGLSDRPTDNAPYSITHADGSAQVQASQAGGSQWLDLGTYRFNAGTGGTVFLNDLTGEPYAPPSRRPIFFDAVRWTFIQPNLELISAHASQTTISAGEVVQVTVTIRNPASVAIASQAPEAGATTDGTSGYVYDESECFLGNAAQTYPAFPKVTGRFRITLGGRENGVALGADCSGNNGDNPWRWGFGPDLQPGETRTVVAAVRMQNYGATPRTVDLTAGLVNENMAYSAQGIPVAQLTVLPEDDAPRLTELSAAGRPLAQIYRLAMTPQSLLARTANPLSIVAGPLVGTIPWDGSDLGWGAGGPLGLSDYFVIEQTRPFLAPSDGSYAFRLDTDDGAWLWVDGSLVVDNHGLHDDAPRTGTVYLSAGLHTLGFKYFEYFGLAHAAYLWQPPSSADWTVVPVLPVQAGRSAATVVAGQQLVIAADDLGGSGIAQLSYWLDDGFENSDHRPPLHRPRAA